MRLTEEQKKMVEDNHGLILWYIDKNNLPFDEYYDICAIALCNAVINFEPDRGIQFSTYATKAMENRIISYLRYRAAGIRRGREPDASLSTPIRISGEKEKLRLHDVIADRGYGGKSPEDIVTSRVPMDSLSERERFVVQLIYEGYTNIEIGEILGCTRQNISRIVLSIREKLKKEGVVDWLYS